MKSLEILIGDKNLSSWSMRPWLVLKASGLAFKETQILLDRPDTQKKLKRFSPSQRVPVLVHGATKIWDSLAIAEYLAELAPEASLWPKDSATRAVARSYAAEMHSGFLSLRGQLSMDIQLRTQIRHLSPGTIADIQRIIELWTAALKKSKGPYLFGEFGIVDAFYAPVVMRFLSYDVQIKNNLALKYMSQVQKHFAVKEWVKAAKKEKPYLPKFK